MALVANKVDFSAEDTSLINEQSRNTGNSEIRIKINNLGYSIVKNNILGKIFNNSIYLIFDDHIFNFGSIFQN